VVEQTAKGIREVGTATGVPCIFGVITCETLEQAINRAGAKQGNQGQKAMLAAVEMVNLTGKIKKLNHKDTKVTKKRRSGDKKRD
jgi:6,7-dimethyl-8-ribityllumazine synthase